ncbi:unnamed protein product [Sphagnum tenellum]
MGGCGRLLNPDTRPTSATVADEAFTVVPTNRVWVAANRSYVVQRTTYTRPKGVNDFWGRGGLPFSTVAMERKLLRKSG